MAVDVLVLEKMSLSGQVEDPLDDWDVDGGGLLAAQNLLAKKPSF